MWLKMQDIPEDQEREERIEQEVTVDTYDESERWPFSHVSSLVAIVFAVPRCSIGFAYKLTTMKMYSKNE
ncbi:MAG: hypothetical protein HY587_07470 [Candidatus Omnitrophica bacterium]|nr:hypothetical protein [Candidatus Omnitrophota bacterium]